MNKKSQNYFNFAKYKMIYTKIDSDLSGAYSKKLEERNTAL